jgi:manganese transport protein
MTSQDPHSGWRLARTKPSLQESYQTIPVPSHWPAWRKMLSFIGPGYLIAVGYMDPGNWATDLAGGSAFGYRLLSVVLISSLLAILLQFLSAKLGIVSGRDLAQACRDHYSHPVNIFLWVLCEFAIAACDLAEVIGCAIALNLLFGIPITLGVLLTALDVFIILYFQNWSFRAFEAFVIGLMLVIGACFWLEILFSKPDIGEIFKGLIPHSDILTHPDMLYISMGILGATVMPHNLYLHSSIVQTRKYEDTWEGKKEALKFVTWDSTIALSVAFFINAAILIVAAAVFHASGRTGVATIEEAYQLLTPLLNAPLASTLFALALLACGQNATLTGTLAGQIVMEGFLDIRLRPWLRRLITRTVAIVPALVCIYIYGESKLGQLLILSQVILSLQLGFAVIPLVMFTGDKAKMGAFTNAPWIKRLSWACALFIVALNLKLFWDIVANV